MSYNNLPKSFQWMPGMLTDNCWRLYSKGDRLAAKVQWSDHWEWLDDLLPQTPNLIDPATVGCLLYLVRRAYVDRGIVVHPKINTFGVRYFDVIRLGDGESLASSQTSEGEALLKALWIADGVK